MPAFSSLPVSLPTRRLTLSIVSCVVRPFSFSSRLMRTTAAVRPTLTAKMGSITLVIMLASVCNWGGVRIWPTSR